MSEKYEKLPVTCDVAVGSVIRALEKMGYGMPVLHLSRWNISEGFSVLSILPFDMDFSIDDDLPGDEWYVEWGGMRVGSSGA